MGENITINNLYIVVIRLTDLHNQKVHIAGCGDRFDFGYHDKKKEQKGSYLFPTLHSTCKTTEESPIGSRFRSCDTIEVTKSLIWF